MPADTEPSSSRKKPASPSMRRWNGRSGSPSGSVSCSGWTQSACSPNAASARPASAPSGNATRRAKKAFPAGISPARPMASQPAATASAPVSGVAIISGTARLLRRCLEQPSRQFAIAGVRDDVLADQLADHLGGRLILRGADLLEYPLLARVEQHREPGGLVLHAGASWRGRRMVC